MQGKFWSILFWSIISAAFIGPGTITTASKAGSEFGYGLLWALTFSTLACIILQEASARITMLSGLNLGQAIYQSFAQTIWQFPVTILIVGAIILGSAAYQTGNLLGAMAGLGLLSNISPTILILLVATLAGLILWIPSLQNIATFLGWLVIVMGFVFCTTAILLPTDWLSVVYGSFVPQMPLGSGWLVLGLVGTTVVPYNLFLGSGISSNRQSIAEMRWGIAVAVILGGLISMAVVVVGTAVSGTYSYTALANTLSQKLGSWASLFFAIGLFCAGFSSAITAPLASAITAQSLFGNKNPSAWQSGSYNFRLVWLLVLLTGTGFALAGFAPIPAIILAQAFNGLVLPLVSIFLVWVVNDKQLLGEKGINSLALNLLTALVLWISLMLGLLNLSKALQALLGGQFWQSNVGFWGIVGLSFLINVGIWWRVYLLRKGVRGEK
ncbi:MAG: divalent metal cation transporter [Microscillaceae bacterium]|jgi:Mn2+/Fe2+ NRAMP family transporter|nr:divalent metal cation transporter [Microscillaceae bacterium]